MMKKLIRAVAGVAFIAAATVGAVGVTQDPGWHSEPADVVAVVNDPGWHSAPAEVVLAVANDPGWHFSSPDVVNDPGWSSVGV